MKSLPNNIAIVTGAAQGLGAAYSTCPAIPGRSGALLVGKFPWIDGHWNKQAEEALVRKVTSPFGNT